MLRSVNLPQCSYHRHDPLATGPQCMCCTAQACSRNNAKASSHKPLPQAQTRTHHAAHMQPLFSANNSTQASVHAATNSSMPSRRNRGCHGGRDKQTWCHHPWAVRGSDRRCAGAAGLPVAPPPREHTTTRGEPAILSCYARRTTQTTTKRLRGAANVAGSERPPAHVWRWHKGKGAVHVCVHACSSGRQQACASCAHHSRMGGQRQGGVQAMCGPAMQCLLP